MTVPVLVNLCDCSNNINHDISMCPQPGSNCITLPTCNGKLCTNFDNVAIERRIQNQSRMPSSQYRDALESVGVVQDTLSFKGNESDLIGMSSRIWGNKNNLRNQSDRSTPSRTGVWMAPGNRAQTLGEQNGISGYVNVPTRGNSTKTTVTGNRPGAMTPGGEGVDVKHGSYHRYLAKKKGVILTKPPVSINTPPLQIQGQFNEFDYRRGFRNNPTNNRVYNSSGMNNMVFKFTPVSLNKHCNNCIF